MLNEPTKGVFPIENRQSVTKNEAVIHPVLIMVSGL
jgi:hypothetical protein